MTPEKRSAVLRDETPKFRNPPVIETVLGVQFERLYAMNIVHYGLFWQIIKDELPAIVERPPLPPQTETFDERTLAPGMKWTVRHSERPDLPRAWFISNDSAAGQQLVQLQPDRFLQNWRRSSVESQSYPSFDLNREIFKDRFQKFQRFVDAYDLGPLTPNQCEVAYVNQIPIPDGRSYGEMIAECFPLLGGRPSDDFLPENPEQVGFLYTYRMDGSRGRLHVSCEPGMESASTRKFLDLRLTARGAPNGGNLPAVLDWLDVGHRWVVKGFKSFTSREMHEIWEIE